MRKKLFCSTLFASALGMTSLWADDDAKQTKEVRRTATIVLDGKAEPIVVQGQQIDEDKLVIAKVWLGVGLKSIEGDLAEFLGSERGILIDEIHEGSPAAKAGVKKGDIILSVDAKELEGVTDLLEIMKSATTEKALTLKLKRKDENVEIKVTPETRPAEMVVGIDLRKAIGDEKDIQLDIDPNDIRVLRLGAPAGIITHSDTALKGDIKLHIVNNNDGKNLEMKIERSGDKPATITITKDGETKTYNESQIEELPMEVRATVESMLRSGSHVRGVHGFSLAIPRMEGLEGQLKDLRVQLNHLGKEGRLEGQKALEKAIAEMAAGADHAKAAAESLNSPEMKKQLDEIRAQVMTKVGEAKSIAAEEAKRAAVQAKKLALDAANRAKSEKAEVEELRKMVEQLKKEIAELRAATKDSK